MLNTFYPTFQTTYEYESRVFIYRLVFGFRMFLERETLLSVQWENAISLLILVIFSTLQFINCSLMSLMVQNTGATALHLSLLTANYYTCVIVTVLFTFKVSFIVNFKTCKQFGRYVRHALKLC